MPRLAFAISVAKFEKLISEISESPPDGRKGFGVSLRWIPLILSNSLTLDTTQRLCHYNVFAMALKLNSEQT